MYHFVHMLVYLTHYLTCMYKLIILIVTESVQCVNGTKSWVYLFPWIRFGHARLDGNCKVQYSIHRLLEQATLVKLCCCLNWVSMSFSGISVGPIYYISLSTIMQCYQWLHDVCSTCKDCWDSIHCWDFFKATTMIIKLVQSLSRYPDMLFT